MKSTDLRTPRLQSWEYVRYHIRRIYITDKTTRTKIIKGGLSKDDAMNGRKRFFGHNIIWFDIYETEE